MSYDGEEKKNVGGVVVRRNWLGGIARLFLDWQKKKEEEAEPVTLPHCPLHRTATVATVHF